MKLQKKKAPETSPPRKPNSLMFGDSENHTSANHCQEFWRRFGERISFAWRAWACPIREIREAEDHADTTNDALWAAIAVARHGGEPGGGEGFRGQARRVGGGRSQMAAVSGADRGQGAARRHRPRVVGSARALELPSGDGADAAGERLQKTPCREARRKRPEPGIVVFPSNRELSIRAHGMAPATLRRHLACLVEAGLIIRRDSPNGKRFARRGQGGEIENAFGFDLTPLVARAGEIENLAEEVRAENRAIALLREKITLARRDIVKMIATGLEEGVPRRLGRAPQALFALAGRYARNLRARRIGGFGGRSRRICRRNREVAGNSRKRPKKSANESHTERHIQNQITNSIDLEPSLREGRAEPPEPKPQEPSAASRGDAGNIGI